MRRTLVDQLLNQGVVAGRTDDATQPQARGHHHGHRHPHATALGLRLDFICLHLLQIKLALFNHVFMYHATMLTRPPPPLLDRPLVKAKRFDDGLQRTTVGQQGNHQHDCFGIATQPVEQCALRVAERSLTFMADVPAVSLTVYADVAFALLPSCRTVDIGTEYLLWVHGCASLA